MRYCLLIFLSISFQSMLAQFTSHIVRVDSAKNRLEVVKHLPLGDSVVFTKRMPYPVYKFIQADIDNDGIDEFLVGSIRITILDSAVRKRINIWRVENNAIVPMWLGSKMPHPVYDFDVNRQLNKTIIRTIEFEPNTLFLVAEYEWHSFGLKFIRYVKREISLDEAFKLVKNI